MGKFNEYSQKATPADNDTLMIYDATSKANKLSPLSGIWNWIVGKLTNAVISNLQTSNQTVIGALNELKSNTHLGTLNDNIAEYLSKTNGTATTYFVWGNIGGLYPSWAWGTLLCSNDNTANFIGVANSEKTAAFAHYENGAWEKVPVESLSNLTTTNKSSLVGAINELNSKVFVKTQNLSTFSINIKLNKNTYTSFIMYGATSQNNGFMYIVFIDVASAKRAVNFIKIADFVAGRTFSGTYSDDTSTLTINANDTIWGGIKLLMFKEENY